MSIDPPNSLWRNEFCARLLLRIPFYRPVALARRLRALLGPVRLIAVTGYGQEDDRRRTAEAGFDLHLVKPVDLAALLRELG